MSEESKYEAYQKKLQGICDENNLAYEFKKDTYPISLIISPLTGLQEQLSLEPEDNEDENSPDAEIALTYKGGMLGYKMSETFIISDALFSKIKNLFKNLHYTWLQFFSGRL